MPDYWLSKAADEDLDELYVYSFTEFGERRADAYFESIEACLERLAANPALGADVSALRAGYLRFAHQRHSIYYKRSKPGILVVRVVGPGMSPEKHLS